MANIFIRYPSLQSTGTINVGTITGPIALPTGAATEATQLNVEGYAQTLSGTVTNTGAGFSSQFIGVGGVDSGGFSRPWSFDANGIGLVGISDFTNTVAIKGANTAPLATDPSLVVSISPNSGISFSDPAEEDTGQPVPAKAIYIGGNKGGNLEGLLLNATGSVQAAITEIDGTVDASNSSTVALGAGASFTGAWVLNTNLASIQVGLKADQDSATNGVEMQFSNDGVSIDHTHNYNYYASGGGIGYLFQPEFRYYRIKFTNGAIAQTSFVLVTTTRATALFPSQYRVSTTITNETQALMTKSVITGQTTGGGGFVNVKVNPSGALTVDATISGIDSALDGQKTMAASFPVVIASDQSAVPASQSGTWNINDISGTISLPTGAATSANQTTLGAQTTKINDGTNTAAVKAASTAAVATDPALVVAVSPNNTVSVTQSGTWNINNVSGTVSLPTGAATSANQTTLGSQTTKINDGTNTAAVKAASTAAVATDPALVVAVSPNNSISSTRKGSTSANAPVYNVYSSTNITTAAYTQLVASTTSAANAIDIFDSSGQAMILATGAAGAETIVAYVPPGGASYQVAIPAATRVAYKALTANATSGYLLIDFWS